VFRRYSPAPAALCASFPAVREASGFELVRMQVPDPPWHFFERGSINFPPDKTPCCELQNLWVYTNQTISLLSPLLAVYIRVHLGPSSLGQACVFENIQFPPETRPRAGAYLFTKFTLRPPGYGAPFSRPYPLSCRHPPVPPQCSPSSFACPSLRS